MKKRLPKKWPLIAVNALFLVLFAACVIAFGQIRGSVHSQSAAKAFSGQSGERFAQVSAFMPAGAAFDETAVHTLRGAIDSAMTAASIEPREGDGALYADAWSARGEVAVSVGDSPAAQVPVIGVGGNFFLFHPIYLKDGEYILPDDLMKDRVVLDESLAWRLFGSVRLAGMELVINGRPHLIAGVVSYDENSNFENDELFGGGAGLYMSYDSLRGLSTGEEGAALQINCYELVMPDPISGFALKTLTDAIPIEDARLIENSSRFKLTEIGGALLSFGGRSAENDAIIYPYWESAARYVEDWLTLILALSVVFLAFPAVCGAVYGVRLARLALRRGKEAAARKIKQRDERLAEEYLQQQIEQAVSESTDNRQQQG